MAEKANIGLGAGDAGAWVTIGGKDVDRSANWAGYGHHDSSDMAANRAIGDDDGRYDPNSDADGILKGAAPFANSGYNSGLNPFYRESEGWLHWFHLVQARYAFSGGTSDIPALKKEDEMDRLYNLQASMQLNHLVGAAQRISNALPKVRQAHSDQQQATQRLAGCWQGSSGETAQDKLAKLNTWAEDVSDELEPLPDILCTAVDEIKSCLQRKADAFAKFQGIHRINGVDMTNGNSHGIGINLRDDDDAASENDDVSMIINYAARRGVGDHARARIQVLADNGVFGPNRGGLLHYLPNMTDSSTMADGSGCGMTVFDDKAQALCVVWRNQFRESAEGYFKAYSNLCHETDVAIQGYLKVVTDALNSFGHIRKPPQPDTPGNETPSPGPSTPAGPAPGPASTTPSTVTPATPTTVTPTVPSATIPSATQFNPAQILSTLASQASQTVQQGLTQTLQQGLSQIQNIAQQGLGSLGGNISGLGSQLSGAGSQLTDVKNLPGSKELANLSALGGNLTVTQSPNGTITAKVTGPDGKPQEYSMGIKDGVPFLKPGPDEAGEPAATGPSDEKGSNSGGARSSGPGGASAAGSSAQSLTPAPSGTATPGSVPGHAVEPRVENSNTGSGGGTNAPAAPGMPMSGMPHPPGGGGKSAPDAERPPSGIVPPKPLWTTVPGAGGQIPDGPPADGPGPELATVGPLGGSVPQSRTVGPELATVGPLESVPSPGPSQMTTTSDPSTPAATRPSTAGVKIEIDTGDAK
ncbi:hypothetical protein [Nocardia kruczakiae]|uniref:hypothetical protein n=1 Tax=Nocardia kruczakiae TaxID=261477 RepID=UPI0012EE6828|nr:hypothetical protein [Nocardia kruczakiae]